MKIHTTAAVVAAGLAISAATALAEVSGNVALTTDYTFRGISQSSELPAIQGGFDYTHDSGFYAGVWGSNVEFETTEVNMELDVYAGYGFEASEDVTFDVGLLHYQYPGDSNSNFDYTEIYGSVSFFDATVGVNYSPEYFGDTDAYYYFYGDYSLALAENFSVDAHAGYNLFDGEDSFSSFIGAESGDDAYVDYSIGVSTEMDAIGLSLAYVGTNIDDDDCKAWCEGRVVFSVSKSL